METKGITALNPVQDVGGVLPPQINRPGPVIDYLTRPMVPSPKSRRRDTLKGIAQFLPFLSGELAKAEGDKLGVALSGLDFLGAAGAPAKAVIKKGIDAIPDQATKNFSDAMKSKNLMFVHNTSEEAIRSFDAMGGLPSPSLAVTESDIPLKGFGEIQLIGKPQKFDPKIDPRNKIYSADAYTPRAPRPFRIANKDSYLQLEKDYGDIANKYNLNISSVVDDMFQQSFKKNAANSYGNSDINRFFDYDEAPKIKFLQEKGVNIEPVYKGGMDLEIKPYLFRDKTPMLGVFDKKTGKKIYSEKDNDIGRDLVERLKKSNEKIKVDTFATKKKVKKELDKYSPQEYQSWVDAEKSKYLQDDLFFKTGGYADNPRIKEYTLDNLVNHMKRQPQVGGEGEGIGTKGIGRLKSALTGTFEDLDQIKSSKSQILDKQKSKEIYDQTENEFFEIANDIYESLPNKESYNQFGFIDDVSDMILDSIRKGGSADQIKSSFDVFNISDKNVGKIQMFIRNLEKSPVQYFEAKPTRVVGFDEFAGAIVPKDTSQDVINILQKRGLKVIKQSDADFTKDFFKTDARKKHFQDQMFSFAPIVGAGGIAALSIEDNTPNKDKGLGSL
tara:strand:- start:1389 stop:3227 length:1839 start_codon:yes stop_codon:yes gene_type:complete